LFFTGEVFLCFFTFLIVLAGLLEAFREEKGDFLAKKLPLSAVVTSFVTIFALK